MPRPRWSPWGQEGGRRGEGRQGWGGGDGRGGGGRLSPSGASQRVWMGPSENHKPQNCHLPSASHQIGDLEPGGGGSRVPPPNPGEGSSSTVSLFPSLGFLEGSAPKAGRPGLPGASGAVRLPGFGVPGLWPTRSQTWWKWVSMSRLWANNEPTGASNPAPFGPLPGSPLLNPLTSVP